MTIKIKDYRIKVSPLAPAFFDLYKVGINQKGNNIGETYERSIAHGTTLGRCVEIIAGQRISNQRRMQKCMSF